MLLRSLLKRSVFLSVACQAAAIAIVPIFFGVAVCATTSAAMAQNSTPQSSSSDKLPPRPTIDANVNRNVTLNDVRYDNKYDIYGGIGFAHFNAGPSLLSGSNLGGFDIQGTRWLTPRLGATANIRGYYGTNATQVNPYGVKGPFVMEHLGLGGVTFRAKQNIHATLDLHALAGFDYGSFSQALGKQPGTNQPVLPGQVGFFNDGTSFATTLGGSIDLNRSPQLAFRISPDYLYTRFGGVTQNEFTLSVGILYRAKFPKRAMRRRP